MKADEAQGGKQAIESLQAAKSTGHTYDLVLLDAEMPEAHGFSVAGIQRDLGLAKAVVLMLTSTVGVKADATRCCGVGMSTRISKPIKRADLLEAIKLALGSQQEDEPASPPAAAHSPAENQERFKILLAEDNLVNQKVAMRFLEKRGHTVILAESGKKALAAWQEQPFDLILMDVQMPELSGIEATASIREQEKSVAKHIPIIAMTAHAMVGDRDRCLASGMDDYISKPINATDLFAAIERVMLSASQTPLAQINQSCPAT